MRILSLILNLGLRVVMANSTPRPCMVPGCPNLVYESNVHRCPEHQREYMKQWAKPRDIKYTSASWRRRSRIFLARHPTCERCGAPSEIAHHIIRRRDGGADDEENLEALRRSCHEAEHNKHGERWGKHER